MSPAGPKARVGVVDGDPQFRSKIAAHLQDGFEVFQAGDHAGAYKLLEESNLDVLLLALTLPSGSQRECLALLRELERSDIDTLVVVLSDDEKKATALKVMDAGAYDYFLKPVEPDILRVILISLRPRHGGRRVDTASSVGVVWRRVFETSRPRARGMSGSALRCRRDRAAGQG